MIDEALKIKDKSFSNSDINFSIGDVRNLKFADSSFDVVYTTRVLINLPTWADQIIAIEECLRILKKGGRLILSEGFWEPLCLLNAIRGTCQLPPLVEHDFNRYLKINKLIEFLQYKKLS